MNDSIMLALSVTSIAFLGIGSLILLILRESRLEVVPEDEEDEEENEKLLPFGNAGRARVADADLQVREVGIQLGLDEDNQVFIGFPNPTLSVIMSAMKARQLGNTLLELAEKSQLRKLEAAGKN